MQHSHLLLLRSVVAVVALLATLNRAASDVITFSNFDSRINALRCSFNRQKEENHVWVPGPNSEYPNITIATPSPLRAGWCFTSGKLPLPPEDIHMWPMYDYGRDHKRCSRKCHIRLAAAYDSLYTAVSIWNPKTHEWNIVFEAPAILP